MKPKKYKIKVEVEYEVMAENRDEAQIALGEKFDRENTTAENEFWNNTYIYSADIEEEDDRL